MFISIFLLIFSSIFLSVEVNSQNEDLSSIAPRGDWSPSSSSGDIILDSNSYYRVFQGEEDIQDWFNTDGTEITGENLQGIGDRAEGDTLDLLETIPRSQTLGRYRSSNGEITATVAEPQIYTLDIYNELGVRLQSGATIRNDQKVLIRSTWNFPEAEDLEIDLLTPDGVEIERQALTSNPTQRQQNILPVEYNTDFLSRETQGLGSTGFRTAFWLLDLDQLRDTGTYTIRVKGVDDLDFEDARKQIRINLGSQTNPQLNIDRDTINRGEIVRYTITGSQAGIYHGVAISKNYLRNQNIGPNQLFRFGGDTVEIGETNQYIYSIVEISRDGTGDGLIDTAFLDTGRFTMKLYREQSSIQEAKNSISSQNELRERSFSLSRTNLELGLGSTYTPGDRVTVSGTASPGIDRVAVYVRRSGDWNLLPLNGQNTTSVRSNGVWSVSRVVLSEEDYGGRLLRLPGRFTIAVVDAADLSSPPPVTISQSRFSRLTTSLKSVRVDQPTIFGDLNIRRVARGDAITISGVSIGSREIVVTFIDNGGNVVSSVRDIRSSGTFEEEFNTDELDRGEITVLVMTSGRDGEFGDGVASDANGQRINTQSASNFRRFVQSFDDQGLTKSQITARILSQSANEVGSDDLIIRRDFRLESPRIEIRDIVPHSMQELSGIQQIEIGEIMMVRGITNRNPSDTSISVEIIEGPNADMIDTKFIDIWNTETGIWSTTFNTQRLDPGRYIIEVDDGDVTDRVQFQLVRQRITPEQERELNQLREFLNERNFTISNLENQINQYQTEVESLEQNNTRLRNQITRLQNRIQNLSDSPQNQPGFTALLGLIVLISISLFYFRKKKNK